MSSREFGGLVKRSRERLGLSQTRVGELVGRAPSTVRAWERGQSIPNDPSALSSLAAVLGLDEVELYRLAGLEPPMVIENFPTIEQSLREIAPVPPRVQPVQPPLVDQPTLDEQIRLTEPRSNVEAVSSETATPEKPAPPEAQRPIGAGPETPVAAGVRSEPIRPAPATSLPVEDVTAAQLEEMLGEMPPRRRTRPRDTNKDPLGRRALEAIRSLDAPWRRKRSASEPVGKPLSASYVEIPEQRRFYRLRIVYTAVAMVVVVLLGIWSLGAARDAIGVALDLLLENLG